MHIEQISPIITHFFQDKVWGYLVSLCFRRDKHETQVISLVKLFVLSVSSSYYHGSQVGIIIYCYFNLIFNREGCDFIG